MRKSPGPSSRGLSLLCLTFYLPSLIWWCKVYLQRNISDLTPFGFTLVPKFHTENMTARPAYMQCSEAPPASISPMLRQINVVFKWTIINLIRGRQEGYASLPLGWPVKISPRPQCHEVQWGQHASIGTRLVPNVHLLNYIQKAYAV